MSKEEIIMFLLQASKNQLIDLQREISAAELNELNSHIQKMLHLID